MTKIRLNRHLKAALITLALTVGVFSIGSLVRASDEYTHCTAPEFVNPGPNSTNSAIQGETFRLQIRTGSCDYQIDNIFVINTGNDGFIPNNNPLLNRPVQPNTLYEFNWPMKYAYTDPPNIDAKIKVEVKQHPLPNTAASREEEYSAFFNINVAKKPASSTTQQAQPAPTSQPASCPATPFSQPADGATVSSTVTFRVQSSTGQNRWFFDFTRSDSVPVHRDSTTPSLSLNTRELSNGNYVVSAFAQCTNGTTSSPQHIGITVNNPAGTSAPSGSQTSSTITYTTPSGETIQVRPELLAQPQYRAVVSAPKSEKLAIKSAIPLAKPDGKNEKTVFKGIASPNNKHRLMIFSEPKELDFTTDKDGNWQVELTESLEPGDHEAYVVLNDSKGKPVERSSVLSFVVPTAEAASAAQAQTIKQTAAIRARYYAAYSGVVILAAMLAFFGYQGVRRRLKASQEPAEPETPTGA